MGKRSCWAAALGAFVCTTGHAAGSAQAESESVDEIVVTGTRATDRVARESLTPIDVVHGEELRALGFPDTSRALQYIEPSVNYARAATTATAANSRPITLRGMAPDQTLVLVNGKRWHATSILNTNNTVGRGSAGFDLDMIPLAAIERIEVLRDGAAAQYGSDAIAGVVNIILASDVDTDTVSLEAGTTEEGDGDYYTASGRTGVRFGDRGMLTLTGEARDQDRTNRANVDERLGRVTYWFGDPEVELYSLAANSSLRIASGELYAFGTFSRKDSTNPSGFRLPGRTPLFPNGYLPKINPVIDDVGATLGWRSSFDNDSSFDVSYTFGRSKAQFDVYDTVNLSLGAQSPTRFDAGATIYEQGVADLTYTLPLPALLSGANFAAGLQLRNENYEIVASEEAAFTGLGADGFAGFNPGSPIDKDRAAYAGFVDVEVHPIERLTLAGAVRYDHYDDFGSATTWKVSTRYEVTDALALRATVGTGFRAPSLQQQEFSAVAGALSAGQLVSVGTLPVRDPSARALGASDLEAEKSDNYSAGFVFAPGSGFELSADWFRIAVRDRIALSEQLAGPQVISVLRAAGITAFEQVRFFNNAVDTTTEGFEITAKYSTPILDGFDLRMLLGYGHFDTELDELRPNPVLPDLPLLNTKSILYITQAQPDEKLTFAAELRAQRWSVQANLAHFGTYTSQPLLLTQKFGAKTVADISVNLNVTRAIILGLGVQNIGDVQPDAIDGQDQVIASTGNSFPTGEESPIGVNGRTYFARVRAGF